MFRRFITLSLFCFAVPFAVFGQEKFGHDDVKQLGVTASAYIREHWPNARESVAKSLPQAAKTVASTLNAMDPGAGRSDRKTQMLVEIRYPWMI